MLYLPRHNIVASGDLVFDDHYPFLDRGEGGDSIPDLIQAVRNLADDHPEAVFLQGHGPLARASDLRRHADYLEFFCIGAWSTLREGLSADEAVGKIDLSR